MKNGLLTAGFCMLTLGVVAAQAPKQDAYDWHDGTQQAMADSVSPTPIILDTDLGGDVDDVLAVRTLCYFEHIGTIRIVMIASSMTNPTTDVVPGISALLQYDGCLGVPVCLRKEPKGTSSGYLSVISRYPHYAEKAASNNAVSAYRKALSALTRKCTIIMIGAYTNLSDLLNSSPDEYSDRNGIDLVKEHVKNIYLMGGAFPDSKSWMNTGRGGVVGAEWNIAADKIASRNVIDKCPVPLIFCGWEIGYAVKCGGSIKEKLPAKDIMIAAMNKWGAGTLSHGRDGYDPITVAAGCLGETMKMGIELVRGTVSFDADTGGTSFSENEKGTHFYMKLPYADIKNDDGYYSYYNVDYYTIYMNHILSKDWWGNNNTR